MTIINHSIILWNNKSNNKFNLRSYIYVVFHKFVLWWSSIFLYTCLVRTRAPGTGLSSAKPSCIDCLSTRRRKWRTLGEIWSKIIGRLENVHKETLKHEERLDHTSCNPLWSLTFGAENTWCNSSKSLLLLALELGALLAVLLDSNAVLHASWRLDGVWRLGAVCSGSTTSCCFWVYKIEWLEKIRNQTMRVRTSGKITNVLFSIHKHKSRNRNLTLPWTNLVFLLLL